MPAIVACGQWRLSRREDDNCHPAKRIASAGHPKVDIKGRYSVRIVAGFGFVATILLNGCSSGSEAVTPDQPSDSTGVVPGSLAGRRFFPADNPWNRDVSADAIDPNSAALISTCGASATLHPDFGTSYQGSPIGIPYVVVRGTQPKVPVSFQYVDESDAGPYPVPPGAPMEGGSSSSGDRHVLVVDADNWKLYELYDAHPVNGGTSWTAASGPILTSTAALDQPVGPRPTLRAFRFFPASCATTKWWSKRRSNMRYGSRVLHRVRRHRV